MRKKKLLAALGAAFILGHPLSLPAAQTRGVIVVFHEHAVQSERNPAADDGRFAADPDAWDYVDKRVLGLMQRLEKRYAFRAKHAYGAALRGFAVSLREEQIAALAADPAVARVEPDLPVGIRAQILPWGVDRVDADLSSALAGNGSGTVDKVNIYILDTGIDAKHRDLDVRRRVNFADGGKTDCNGHGTHVAGIAAARDNAADVVGVAAGAALHAVRVVDCAGQGTVSGAIKGVDWVSARAVRPAVANLSLGGDLSPSLDDAIRNAVASGILFAIAAGNGAADACASSPARIGAATAGVITTAATDRADAEAPFSNAGPCVDLWAPGVDIPSTALGGGTTTLSGTSMASPHVAGAAALYLSRNRGATPADVEAALRLEAVATGTASREGAPIRRLSVLGF